MNAVAVLARADAAGVTVEADGDRLRLVAAAAPPMALLHDLAGAKADILDLLAERAAIEHEPPIPPPGGPEREWLDRRQRVMVAGFLMAADCSRGEVT